VPNSKFQAGNTGNVIVLNLTLGSLSPSSAFGNMLDRRKYMSHFQRFIKGGYYTPGLRFAYHWALYMSGLLPLFQWH